MPYVQQTSDEDVIETSPDFLCLCDHPDWLEGIMMMEGYLTRLVYCKRCGRWPENWSELMEDVDEEDEDAPWDY